MDESIESIKNQILELSVNDQGRRRYTKAIKTSVFKLHDGGMNLKSIADKTGIHFTTLHGWFSPTKKIAKFKEIKIEKKSEISACVEIYFPSGIKVTGLGLNDFVQILKQGALR